MYTMDKSLLELYEKKLITYEQMHEKLKEPEQAERIKEQAAADEQLNRSGRMWS